MSQIPNLRKVKITNPSYYQIDPNDSNGLIINPEFNEKEYGPQILFGYLRNFCFQSGQVCVKTEYGITVWFDPCSDPNFRFINNEEADMKATLKINQLVDLMEENI